MLNKHLLAATSALLLIASPNANAATIAFDGVVFHDLDFDGPYTESGFTFTESIFPGGW